MLHNSFQSKIRLEEPFKTDEIIQAAPYILEKINLYVGGTENMKNLGKCRTKRLDEISM